MKLQIGNRAIELLEDNPNYELLPSGQAEAYRLLMALGEGQHSEAAIVEQLGLKSHLPLWSRIEHLEERGLVRVLQTLMV
jgi:hypothetical protein